MRRIRRLSIVAAMTATMLIGGVPAFAADPLTPSTYVTDSDNFLSDEQRAKLETDAESFSSKFHPIYAVIVPNFSDEAPDAWCRATLANIRNNYKALLYVVGYEDGKHAYCVGPELKRTMNISSYADGYVRSALSQARQKYTSTPLTPDEAAAGLTTFISSVRNSYGTNDRQSYAPHSQTSTNYEAERQQREASGRLESIKTIVLFFFLGILVIGSIIFGEWSKAREEDERAAEIEEAACERSLVPSRSGGARRREGVGLRPRTVRHRRDRTVPQPHQGGEAGPVPWGLPPQAVPHGIQPGEQKEPGDADHQRSRHTAGLTARRTGPL